MQQDTDVPSQITTTDVTTRQVVAEVKRRMGLKTHADAMNKIIYEHAIRHGLLSHQAPLVRTGPGGDYTTDHGPSEQV